MPRPLVSAQKSAQKTKKYQNRPRDGAAKEWVKSNHAGGGKETRNWRHDPPWYRQVPECMSRTAGGTSGLRNGGGRAASRRENPQGLPGMLSTLRAEKGGRTDG